MYRENGRILARPPKVPFSFLSEPFRHTLEVCRLLQPTTEPNCACPTRVPNCACCAATQPPPCGVTSLIKVREPMGRCRGTGVEKGSPPPPPPLQLLAHGNNAPGGSPSAQRAPACQLGCSALSSHAGVWCLIAAAVAHFIPT